MQTPSFDFEPTLRAILVRLVRIAIGCGVPYQAFARLLRSVYFEVASTFEPVDGKPNSDSRVSLLTGLPRREIRSLRDRGTNAETPVASLERQVMHAWSSDRDLLDADGNMMPLYLTARLGGPRSFEALVERCGADVRSRSLLDEWLRKGFVFIDEQDRVHIARQRPHFGMEGASGAAALIGELSCDLLSGFERIYQLGKPVPGFSFQVVYGHRLTEASVQLICAEALREGSATANRLNRLIVEREAQDASQPEATRRVSFGFGCFQADQREEPGLLTPPPPPDAR